ncbi:uncharacterized protein PFL1_06598 [Pseudozyma flocculosa PF-1]|uniref:DASH complex subunit SPC19 n=2 Tax=Pseudozyma flocculosa TaxID=84751 RepID=A0A5C3FA82_9BASI|nr:uncharacterized protein PFL1_06598 [Pseudozyma flocculosa PF-1]EPQ25924.1 hypothetical protein PFL1_06598 [Pseudozyma flocculosa PF-1]SPO40575.1 uncharacterized protein PSFLO_06057 [Pseudozyma flocculosa]
MMHHGPRQSLYPPSSAAQQSSILSSLHSCVASTQRSVDCLGDSIEILSQATEDFPRLKVVLSNRRYHDLLSERDIHQARSHISSEVLPHINQLVTLASSELEKLERKAQALRNKTAAQEARLASLAETKSLEGREAEAARKRSGMAASSQSSLTGQRGSATPSAAGAGRGDNDEQEQQELVRSQRRTLDAKRKRRMQLMRLVERLENGERVDVDAELARTQRSADDGQDEGGEEEEEEEEEL